MQTIRRVSLIRKEAEQRLRRSRLVIVLLGASGEGLEERRAIATALINQGIIALVPEDDFPPEIGPSVVEAAVLRRADVDLVFLNVESWGAVAEFGQFSRDPRIAPKLRVLVRPEHHPIHSAGGGYLRDLYLTHLAVYGHVYPIDGGQRAQVLPATTVVHTLAERYREIKAFSTGITK